MADIQAIANDLSGLTVMQVADLVKVLEGKWGVSAAAAAPVMAAAAGAPAAAAAAEEQTEFAVHLMSTGDKKINVIKAKPAASKGKYVKSIALSSTMGPGVRVDLASVEGHS